MLTDRTSMNPAQTAPNRERSGFANVDDLESAFLHFVEATQELEASQKKLSEEIYRLTEDLARSNAALKVQIDAKGRLAEELAALLSALPTGVIILQDAKIVAFNDISVNLVPELAVGMLWGTPKHWTGLDEAHYRCQVGSQSWILRPEQRHLADERVLVLLHDVSATFRAREHAEREAKLAAMGKMVAEIAHQLRTPLATATLYAGHLAKPSLPTDKRERFAHQLNQQLLWLDGLVSRMMSFLRTRSGPPQMICVSELIEECRASIEPLFEAKSVKLDLHMRGGEHLLTVHRDQIRGGIVAILENALSVSGEGQIVQLIAEAARSRLDIWVHDCGPGIPDSLIDRLFEPFATGSPKGTGLGLAIAKAAIESHRGQIQAQNRDTGGASFHIVLPVLEQL
jgi:two-component system sensor histidine kinase FlrB